MMSVTECLESGILEMYVMGVASEEESRMVEEMAASYPEVRGEIDEISRAIEQYAMANAVNPHPSLKPLVIAAIDYTERLTNGEQPVFPPVLNENSTTADFAEWTDGPEMNPPEDFTDIYARIIAFNEQAATAVVWIKTRAEEEVHTDEHERFLILEGTCDIRVGDKVYGFKRGDYFDVPLHIPHSVHVTSSVPCKVLLQRLAA